MPKYPLSVLFTKNTEHHIERHYEIESNKNYYLQQMDIEEEFYEDRFSHCFRLSDSVEFKNLLLDEYGDHEAIDDFDYLHNRQFTSFFTDNSIDVPRCFSSTKSVRRPLNEVKLLKLNNYLMRDGKRAQSFKFLSKSLWDCFYDVNSLQERPFKSNYSWRAVFLNLNYMVSEAGHAYQFPSVSEEPSSFGHVMGRNYKSITDDWNFNTWLFTNMCDSLPMFSFYIYKVDKKIFKNTRGKSGKFTFIWKYVAPYKRLFLVMHWLLKELRVRPGRSFTDRLTATLGAITLAPKKTWIYRIRKFSHNYVYRNARQTLAENYRTVTK